MSGTQGPSQPDWGDSTEWQRQPGQGQPPYGAGGQQPPPGAPPPYAPQQGWQGATGPAIQTWLVPAILVTLFCFLPTGIAAIVFASQVNSKKSAGDYAGAQRASNQARLWTLISLGVGLLFGVIIIIATAASSGSSSGY